MPLYTFNFTSSVSTGEARLITQQIVLPNRPPRGARYYIRQVSATSTNTFSNSFKWVHIYIPELMGITDQCLFQTYTVSSTNVITPSIEPKGFRFYLPDSTSQPFTMNTFPHLNLGRHHMNDHTLTLQLTPYRDVNTLGHIYSFSVVIEWDTE